MFVGKESTKTSFLEQNKAARAERAHEKKRESSVVVIQRCFRGYIARKTYRQRILTDFDALLPPSQIAVSTDTAAPNAAAIDLQPCLHVYPIASRFLKHFRTADASDGQRLQRLCRYLIASLDSESSRLSYVGVALQKDHSLSWIRHIKLLLYQCLEQLRQLRPEHHAESVSLALFLHTLVAFTSPAQWRLLQRGPPALQALRPGMAQLCNNIQGALVQKGFFQTLRAVLLRGTCRTLVVALKPVSLAAIVTLATRPLVSGQFSDNLMSMFLVQILSVPALVHHLHQLAAESLAAVQSLALLQRSLRLLENEQSMKIIANSMKGTQSLALLANVVQLFQMHVVVAATTVAVAEASSAEKQAADELDHQFTFVCTRLLQAIPNTVGAKSGAVSQWHTLLGWFAPAADAPQNENLALIKEQIYLLWSHRVVHRLMGGRLKGLAVGYENVQFPNTQPAATTMWRRALERSTAAVSSATSSSVGGGGGSGGSSKGLGGGGVTSSASRKDGAWRRVGCDDVMRVALVCGMYQAALTTLAQLKLDILSGLCYNDTLLHDMFLLLASLGPNCGLKSLLELLTMSPKVYAPPLDLLLLFCNLMTHYVIILDDIEMYEKQEPFQLNDYTGLSYFLNNFLFKTIQENIFEPRQVTAEPLFIAMHTLLMCLYRRDSRRQFAPTNHWLIHELKPAHFLADLDKGKRHTHVLLQRMPHIIPHEDRVKLFRKYVQNEKSLIGIADPNGGIGGMGGGISGGGGVSPGAVSSTALITVHRDRIVEDGYRQLAMLPTSAMKGCIRVRFVNQQGLDEAGIDQDGVFKEFLEETIQRVFDPSLNLFKTTGDQRLYPSPTSHVQENHQQLFEFVGLMLGKAVYEGIVVDVPFASFFLSQLLGQTHQALYSCMDELPSLDQELYRSLTFIKHYQGDVADLDLTFAIDEDQMGEIVSHELHPGGRSRPVTNDNKINYIHYSAYFRMHTQIREQTTAFIRGFRSIVNTDWLGLFSTPELQRLISGDTTPLDLKDLRKHTQYYGGFHDSHRVVGWLWDILAKDFTENERKLFLKFVTSCSKPPLLGFAHLEPPFSIRCVEVGDDEDTGDTIGSVIRGFFTIRKKDPLNRLPTSSTCFNLLKLPNYQKKSTLREKLRYAVSSNTGFELS